MDTQPKSVPIGPGPGISPLSWHWIKLSTPQPSQCPVLAQIWTNLYQANSACSAPQLQSPVQLPNFPLILDHRVPPVVPVYTVCLSHPRGMDIAQFILLHKSPNANVHVFITVSE